ncbi:hypothetical protein RV12_GL001421 [Enterococcus quebecensis]|nr:hypothetical protein RV12_GL001421 [Enterococcus quebecensis]
MDKKSASREVLFLYLHSNLLFSYFFPRIIGIFDEKGTETFVFCK